LGQPLFYLVSKDGPLLCTVGVLILYLWVPSRSRLGKCLFQQSVSGVWSIMARKFSFWISQGMEVLCCLPDCKCTIGWKVSNRCWTFGLCHCKDLPWRCPETALHRVLFPLSSEEQRSALWLARVPPSVFMQNNWLSLKCDTELLDSPWLNFI